MLWRVQCTFRRVSWLAVVAMAFALVSCGGSPVDESVSGPSVAALPDGSAAAGTLTASGKKPMVAKVLLCHKGKDELVPPSAVSGHLGHGDSLDSCSAPETCPCFSAADIQASGSQCSSEPTSTCGTGEPYYLFLGCDPGGSVPPGVLGVYLSHGSTGGYCQRDDVFGSFEQTGLSEAEYQACVAAIADSGYCF